jgi:DNA-binding MarR family transcriptional regulator
MPEQHNDRDGTSSYWYSDADPDAVGAVQVLQALRRFRSSDAGMRRRVQKDMDMNETDLLAIRHLIRAEASGKPAGPTELAKVLDVSTAATAKLVARLVSSGHIRREAHPHDGRAQVLYATANAHSEVRSTLGAAHQRMLEVAESLSPEQQRTVVYFLDQMSGTLAEPAQGGSNRSHGTP